MDLDGGTRVTIVDRSDGVLISLALLANKVPSFPDKVGHKVGGLMKAIVLFDDMIKEDTCELTFALR